MRFVIALLGLSALSAQTFEVASVKANHSDSGRSGFPQLKDGRLTAENTPLRLIVMAAYGLGPAQISGPSWMDSEHYDLEARSPAGVSDTAIEPMLQALLKDRFQFVGHMETKETAVFNLVVLKDGPKFVPVDLSHIPPTPPRMAGAESMLVGVMKMTNLAERLSSVAGRPVIDKTGLDDRYFIAVQYARLSTQSANNPNETIAPDIFEAVQRQLGLKLEPGKGPVTTLVVDHCERVPSGN